jgi:hypothetical protein
MVYAMDVQDLVVTRLGGDPRISQHQVLGMARRQLLARWLKGHVVPGFAFWFHPLLSNREPRLLKSPSELTGMISPEQLAEITRPIPRSTHIR